MKTWLLPLLIFSWKKEHTFVVNNSRKTAADCWNDRQKEKRILKLAQEEAGGFEWKDDLDILEEEGEVDESGEESDDDGRALGLDDLKMPGWLCDDSVLKLMCLITALNLSSH